MKKKPFYCDLFWVLVVLLLLAACSKTPVTVSTVLMDSEMVMIPAGPFLMGSDKMDQEGKSKEFGFVQPLYVDEHPQHTVKLSAFWIDKYEVSNAEFLKFFQATQSNLSQQGVIQQQSAQTDWHNLPVSQVTWYQAQGYCLWLDKRLPTEQEWEKAARGPEGREYPWGDNWNADNLNKGTVDNDIEGLTTGLSRKIWQKMTILDHLVESGSITADSTADSMANR